MSVLGLGFWRWAIAFLALAVFVVPGPGLRLPRRALLASFGLGLVGQVATSGLYTWSLAHVGAALGSFLLYLSPVFVALLAWLLLGEALTRRGLLALALALGGLALLALAPGVQAAPFGVALAVAAAGCYAGVIVAGRRLTATQEPLRVAAWLMAGAATGFGLAALATRTFGVPPSPAAWSHIILLGVVSTALSVGTFYLALPLLGAPRAALVSTLEPVSTALVAYAVLGEVLAPLQAAGAALVLGAVALLASEGRGAAAAWPRRRPQPNASLEERLRR
jgi:drug/metabolite transporter (DMT)-like permease